jgi:hypothetical protein
MIDTILKFLGIRAARRVTYMSQQVPPRSAERAFAPHCDANVLHAPAECVHCDKYPDWQTTRYRRGINFTGRCDPTLLPDTASLSRPVETINRCSRPGEEVTGYF